MKVILIGRPEAAINAGGDRIQILKTKEYLNKIGVDATVTFDPYVDLKGYELAHLFTLSTWAAYRRIKKYSLPYVVSPIYWDSQEMVGEHRMSKPIWRKFYYKHELNPLVKTTADIMLSFKEFIRLALEEPGNLRQALYAALEYPKVRLNTHNKSGKEIILNSNMVLPNAELEMRCLEDKFNLTTRYRVIPNAADRLFANADRRRYPNPLGDIKDYILCVAAIFSFRKNQLSLIKAVDELGINLVLTGGGNSSVENKYLAACKKISKKNVFFLPVSEQKDLLGLYSWARVHVLPSWYETPGLATLEAALTGCNVVSTDRGTAREYLDELGWYCAPNDIKSIRDATIEAYNTAPRPELKKRVLGKYIWEITAEETKKAYHLAI